MFSLFNKKDPPDSGDQPLDRSGRKQGRLLLRGVRKFLRYNKDLLNEKQIEKIHRERDEFATALEDPESRRKDLESAAETLTETCRKSTTRYRPSAIKENLEVIFVAVLIAMGIRAYFVQQFKIPTGSMQPTLNGIIAYPDPSLNPGADYRAPEGYERPGFARRVWDKIWHGRSHVDWVAEEDDVLLFDPQHFYTKTHFLFFPRVYLKTQKGHTYSVPGSETRVASLVNFGLDNFLPPARNNDLKRLQLKRAVPVKEGQTIAKGYIDTGDHLVVDKFTYHWRKPERGEVFVFDTRNIDKIQRNLIAGEIASGVADRGITTPRQGSQHYIKRLVGLPGDKLEIRPPQLFVNGAPAEEFGMKRVAARENGYPGYILQGTSSKSLSAREYWAMGDNSPNSSDSRDWGVVPEENIVGRALTVYYPFGQHFGKVR